MSELRWILLAAGLLLLIGIYLYSRRRDGSAEAPPIRREPGLASETQTPRGQLAAEEPEVANAEADSELLYGQSDLPLTEPATSGRPDVDGAEKIIAIHVAARRGRRFRGPDVVGALEAEALQFGDYDIFHRRTGSRSVFSVSSMVEPGRFDRENLENYTTPGLSFFMVMPGPDSPVAAFTDMLSTARRVATTLDGDVLDESGSTLSRQAASHMREQIIEFAHRVR